MIRQGPDEFQETTRERRQLHWFSFWKNPYCQWSDGAESGGKLDKAGAELSSSTISYWKPAFPEGTSQRYPRFADYRTALQFDSPQASNTGRLAIRNGYWARRLAEAAYSPRPQRHGAEWDRRCPVDHQLQIDAVIRQLQKVELLELRLEFADKIRSVLCADPEGNN